jgi:HAE1 family hydrophobic/amphiphilic exporter-1
MIFLVFVVLGIYSIPRLKIEAVPDVNLPTLTVTTSWNGASPQAVQRSISIPIEEAVQDVHGIEKIESTSRAGSSVVTLSFRRGVDIDFARLELNEQLGDVRRNLPLGALQPQILPFVPEEFRTQDFVTFSLESELSSNELRELAETWVIPQVVGINSRMRRCWAVRAGEDHAAPDAGLYGIAPTGVRAVDRMDGSRVRAWCRTAA